MDLSNWLNPYYLRPEICSALPESALARPANRYAVLDGLFRDERIEEMAGHHFGLAFRDDLDRQGASGEPLPYDAAMKPMDMGDVGSEVLLSEDFAHYCAA